VGNNFIIDDGVQEYTFTNKMDEVFARFSFNPSDTSIIERYEAVADAFGKYDLTEDNVTEKIKEINADIRKQMDYLLNRDVSSGMFMVYEPCSVFANGDFYAEVMLDTIGEIVGATMKARIKRKMEKVNKATAKYHK